jgi:YhcH/YjgK/YiaL family protein
MISGSLATASRYFSLNPLFADAFAWCTQHAASVTSGTHAIHGDDLFVITDSGSTQPSTAKRFESHRRYIDIQVTLSGREAYEWLPITELEIDNDFNVDNDVAFYSNPLRPPGRIVLGAGEYAIFFPEDGHRAMLNPADRPVPYRKVIFKVAV